MDLHADLSREKCHPGKHQWPPVLAVGDSMSVAKLPRDGSGLAGWTIGTGGMLTKQTATGRGSPVKQPASVGWCPSLGAQGTAHAGVSAEALLDDVRRAMEWNPEATRAAVLHLVRVVAPPVAPEPVEARGGLAPWQKRKIDRYLKQNLDRPMRIDALAEHVTLSVSHFSRAFKQSFGTTPHMHMVRLRLELAQQLMLTSEEPLSQIAVACGLADQAHLSKLFRRMVGETPNAWRRRNLTDAQAEARSRRPTRGQFVTSVVGSRSMAGLR